MGRKDSPSSGPICQYIRRTPVSKHYCTTDCSRAPLGYAVCSGIGWLLDTQVQLVGLNVFCLQRPNGSTPNGTQHNTGWQTCTVTADSWLGQLDVSFRARVHLSPRGWLWVYEKQVWPVCTVSVVSGCSACCIPDPRDIKEEGWTKVVRVMQGV